MFNSGGSANGDKKMDFEILISLDLPEEAGEEMGKKVCIVEAKTNNVMWEGTRGDTADIVSFRKIDISVMFSTGHGGWVSTDTRSVSPGKKYEIAFYPADISSRTDKFRIIERF